MTVLEARFHQVLAGLELLSHGSTQAWNSSGAPGGEPDDRVVAQVVAMASSSTHPDQPPHLRYRALWDAALDDEKQRERVVADAERELAGTRKRSSPVAGSLSEGEILRERVLAASGWSLEDLARSLRTTVGVVRRIRIAAGVDEAGRPLLVDGDDATRAREMAERGMSERAIGMVLGGGKSTIRRMLGKAA